MNEKKKELLREYKETSPVMGVYVIRNKTNGKCFVGSSRNLRARLNRHRMELASGRDRILALQRDWNELGSEAFELETLDVLEPRDAPGYDPGPDLEALEELWLDKLKPFGERGYNEPPRSGAAPELAR